MSSAPLDRSPKDGAQRLASILVGAAVIFLVGWMTYEASTARPLKREADAAPPPPPVASVISTATEEAGAAKASSEEPDAGLFLPALSLGDAAVLPSSAPRSVKIGVVLVAFAGAEGASSTAPSKKDAQARAESLLADAQSDFHRAVASGDSGSSDDIGRLPRGVLDPQTEVAVFGLAPGEVSGVLETPRGYWIVKRIE